MAIKCKHSDVYSMYFCTFACYNWLHLFELTKGYDLVYNLLSREWNLTADFVPYEHSSAPFYEEGIIKHFEPRHYKSLQVGFV